MSDKKQELKKESFSFFLNTPFTFSCLTKVLAFQEIIWYPMFDYKWMGGSHNQQQEIKIKAATTVCEDSLKSAHKLLIFVW